MSVKEEMNRQSNLLPSKWGRNTVADGNWLQKYTLGRLSARDDFLAEQIDQGGSDIDDISAKLEELSGKTINISGELNETSSFLSAAINYVSASVTESAHILDTTLQQEISERKQDRDDLSSAIRTEFFRAISAENDLKNQMDLLNAATDVINVFGTYSSFSSVSARYFDSNYSATYYLTDNDIIKIINDEYTEIENNLTTGHQTYYQWNNNPGVTGNPKISSDGSWNFIGYTDPYYNRVEIDEYLTEITSTYLSAKGAVLSGKNIVITEDENYPKITIATKDNVEFTNVTSNSLKATTLEDELGAVYSVENVIKGAKYGDSASAWITSNLDDIVFSSKFEKIGNVITGYNNTPFAGGISSISVRGNNVSTAFTGRDVCLEAGQGVGFTTGANRITITAEGRNYTGGDYIDINSNEISVTGTLINSAESGQSAYDWITTKSASLYPGQGISFYSAGENLLGISAEGTSYQDGNYIEVDNVNKQINLSSNISAENISAQSLDMVGSINGSYYTANYCPSGIHLNNAAHSPAYIYLSPWQITAVQGDTTATTSWYSIITATQAMGNFVSAADSQSITFSTATRLPVSLVDGVYYLI